MKGVFDEHAQRQAVDVAGLKFPKGTRIAVTGAGGFIGSAVRPALRRAGADVVAIDIQPAPSGDPDEWYVSDLLEEAAPTAAFDNVDTLIHLAWRSNPASGNANLYNDARTNVACAARVFEHAASAGVRRIVYLSSGGTVYGSARPPTNEDTLLSPIGGYGAGKAAAELYLRAVRNTFKSQTCILRVSNPFGPGQLPDRGQGFIATAIKRSLDNTPLSIFGSGTLSRDYLYIEDLTSAVVHACLNDSPDVIWNVGSGVGVSLDDVMKEVFLAVGSETEVHRLPQRIMDVSHVCLDVSRIKAETGWVPQTSLRQGIEAAVAWQRSLLARGDAILTGSR